MYQTHCLLFIEKDFQNKVNSLPPLHAVSFCMWWFCIYHKMQPTQTFSRQLAESKDSLQFSNKLCEQLENRAEEMEKLKTSLQKLCESQQLQLEQKTATVEDLEEKLESVQKEYQQMKEKNQVLCNNGSKSLGKKTTNHSGKCSDEDTVDHPTASQTDLLKTVQELTEKLRTTNYQKQKYEKGLREVLVENQTLSWNLERVENDVAELQARLRAYEDAMEKQSLERSCSSPFVHSGQHLSVSSTPTHSSVFQYTGGIQSPVGDDSSQPSLKTSRTTDSLLGTSLFSELDSQYSDLQEHYDKLVQQCTCSAGLAHRNRLKKTAANTADLNTLVTPSGANSALSGAAPFKDLFEEVFATLKQTAAIADKLVQRKKSSVV